MDAEKMKNSAPTYSPFPQNMVFNWEGVKILETEWRPGRGNGNEDGSGGKQPVGHSPKPLNIWSPKSNIGPNSILTKKPTALYYTNPWFLVDFLSPEFK